MHKTARVVENKETVQSVLFYSRARASRTKKPLMRHARERDTVRHGTASGCVFGRAYHLDFSRAGSFFAGWVVSE